MVVVPYWLWQFRGLLVFGAVILTAFAGAFLGSICGSRASRTRREFPVEETPAVTEPRIPFRPVVPSSTVIGCATATATSRRTCRDLLKSELSWAPSAPPWPHPGQGTDPNYGVWVRGQGNPDSLVAERGTYGEAADLQRQHAAGRRAAGLPACVFVRRHGDSREWGTRGRGAAGAAGFPDGGR